MIKLVKPNHPALHKIATEVPAGYNAELLLAEMVQLINKHRAIGLAAPQVGVSMRIIIIRIDAVGNMLGLINPVITKRKGIRVTKKESCLSYPNYIKKVTRYKRVTIEGYTHDWHPVELKLKGLAARCAQHEVDHLNGITIG